MNEHKTLYMTKEGEWVKVAKLVSEGSMRRRLLDLGLAEGALVKCLQKSPAGSPVAYLICGAVIAIRKEDTDCILVQPVKSKPSNQCLDAKA